MTAHEVKITILVDNQAAPGLAVEHGFALWIEAGNQPILFDTGQGQALAPNAEALGIDLAAAQALVLSHGHFDHTGAVPHVLAAAGACKVYAHPKFAQPRYAVRDGVAREIGIPPQALAAIEKLAPQRRAQVSGPLRLSENIGLTGPIVRRTAYEDTGGPFFLDARGRNPDPIDDDLALWIDTRRGLVVCAGCCHAGLVNTLEQVRRLNNQRPIRAVIGGFHLVAAGSERLSQTIEMLKALDPDLVAPCHCTGERAMDVLQQAMPEKVKPGAAGMIYRF